jgi:uncharacterized protein (TIGR00297 family)
MAATLFLSTLLAGIVTVAALLAGALALDGAIAATVVGSLVFTAGGPRMAAILLLFFTSSSLLSRLPGMSGGGPSSIVEKGSRRDAMQVLANGGVAAFFALLHILHPSTVWIAGFCASLAAATADTWATEIGSRSRTTPRSIVTGATVRSGTSGGITPLGLGAAAAGAAVVAISGHLLTGVSGSWSCAVAAAGFGGAILDSVLGATLQGVRNCPVCRVETEQAVHRTCGARTYGVRGYAWLNNDAVNAVACLAAAAMCLALVAVI